MRTMWTTVVMAVAVGCAGPAYTVCEVADDCTVPDEAPGDAACVEKNATAFCAVTCTTDPDCDAVDDAFDWVCAPFESNPVSYCFPACADEGPECPDGYACRSTGGGSANRKICFPE